ncbi:hypothetical protein K402DRAFT_468011 [Aulographum hederae CBS 113979]|uniref:Chromo domain-containing protein n=1 Tax=Aulographum hederae CBS 113979 TaxID=1176131 RepID=A0A6G1GJ04_9PEZI|nr:hypothetical protein K402DRAFT_468011 [Aulographum hederae CBS 113979]
MARRRKLREQLPDVDADGYSPFEYIPSRAPPRVLPNASSTPPRDVEYKIIDRTEDETGTTIYHLVPRALSTTTTTGNPPVTNGDGYNGGNDDGGDSPDASGANNNGNNDATSKDEEVSVGNGDRSISISIGDSDAQEVTLVELEDVLDWVSGLDLEAFEHAAFRRECEIEDEIKAEEKRVAQLKKLARIWRKPAAVPTTVQATRLVGRPKKSRTPLFDEFPKPEVRRRRKPDEMAGGMERAGDDTQEGTAESGEDMSVDNLQTDMDKAILHDVIPPDGLRAGAGAGAGAGVAHAGSTPRRIQPRAVVEIHTSLPSRENPYDSSRLTRHGRPMAVSYDVRPPGRAPRNTSTSTSSTAGRKRTRQERDAPAVPSTTIPSLKGKEKQRSPDPPLLNNITVQPTQMEEDFHSGDEDGDEDEEDEEYEIESILQHQYLDGILYFFVKWVSYPEEEGSWMLESDLVGATDMLRLYKIEAGFSDAGPAGHSMDMEDEEGLELEQDSEDEDELAGESLLRRYQLG